MTPVFEWDARKAGTNQAKHGVSFALASRVFADPLARVFPDPDHSVAERRSIIIGHASTRDLLIVAFAEPDPDRVRIISARVASKRERKKYEENVLE